MKRSEQGFSLIELLIVVLVISIIASVAIPYLQKALRIAENGNTFATLRTISNQEVAFYGSNNRFARLTEVNNIMSGSLGTPSGNDIMRGKFTISMSPAAPTDAELRNGYTITATRNVPSEGVIYLYQVTQSGELTQILP